MWAILTEYLDISMQRFDSYDEAKAEFDRLTGQNLLGDHIMLVEIKQENGE